MVECHRSQVSQKDNENQTHQWGGWGGVTCDWALHRQSGKGEGDGPDRTLYQTIRICISGAGGLTFDINPYPQI